MQEKGASDTIFALSSGVPPAAIGVVRISGPRAGVALKALAGRRPPPRRASLADLRRADGGALDRALILWFPGPATATGEDLAELHLHGGRAVVAAVEAELAALPGLRRAEAGEFTRRAFLNGRIDLMQAEAVIDLIRSKSDRAFSVARKQAEGVLSKKIKALRQTVIELLAHIEVNIDYPEHDVEEMTSAYIREQCQLAIGEIDKLLKTANEGKILREGIMTAIVGRPNVGKSSLMNVLTQENKAIVTDIPGTTRDVIEQFVTLNGIPLRLLDTAGIRETSDVVERIGVERSRDALQEADLILFVLNYNEPLQEDDRKLLEQLQGRSVVAIINKMDLPGQLELEEVERYVEADRIVRMSVLEEKGLDGLEATISEMFFEGQLEANDLTYVSNVRHISLLKRAKSSLEDAIEATYSGIPIDVIQIDARQAWESLGEILGDEAGDSLIDQIFSQFCLGK